MSDTISIKRSTMRIISVIVFCVIVLSILGFASYQVYLYDRETLTSQITELQHEYSDKSREVRSIDDQVTDLQTQLNNLEGSLSSKESYTLQLSSEIDNLNRQILEANQEITDLSNQLAEAQALIAQLEEIYPAPIYK